MSACPGINPTDIFALHCPDCTERDGVVAILAAVDTALAPAKATGAYEVVDADGGSVRAMEREEIITEILDEKHALEGQRTLAAAEIAALQRKLAVLDGEVLAYGADGCLTGDCPHETQAECNACLAKSYVDFIEDLRAILDAKVLSGEWTDGRPDARNQG